MLKTNTIVKEFGFFTRYTEPIWKLDRSVLLSFELSLRQTKFIKDTQDECICKSNIPNTELNEQIYQWRYTNLSLMPSKNPESLEFFLTERYRLF